MLLMSVLVTVLFDLNETLWPKSKLKWKVYTSMSLFSNRGITLTQKLMTSPWRNAAPWLAPMVSSALFHVESTSRLGMHHLQWSGAPDQSSWKLPTVLPTILSPFDMKLVVTMSEYMSVIKSFNNKKL